MPRPPRVAPQTDTRRGLPTVAIVGRPNVGKSTLLNRFLGRREAIVEERPGVTRDRKDVIAEWNGVPFVVTDTGGWMVGGSTLDEKVSKQAEKVFAEADVALFVVDTVVGITEEDEHVAQLLRKVRAKGSVLVIANKADGETRDSDVWAFTRLGLGDPWGVSALHGRGTGDLLDEVVKMLPVVPIDPLGAGDDPTTEEAFDHVRALDETTFGHIGVGGAPFRPWSSRGGPTSANPPCSTV